MNNKTVQYISITQPIGTFYLCSIPAMDLLKIVDVDRRSTTNDAGIQREKNGSRVAAIGQYCSDPDAVFPTPIVVSVHNPDMLVLDESKGTISYPDDHIIIGSVLDGQHRLWGINESEYRNKFNLPVVFMFGLTTEEEAYIFATINSNQTKVPVSLIYDLFENSQYHSPQKVAHYVARMMNSQPDSPFYNRLKMLGKKESGQDNATLSQGTFAKAITELISKKPNDDILKVKKKEPLEPDDSLPFRKYYIEEKDVVIAKILFNCFNALKNVFENEWNNPQKYILWKTTGFCGIMKAMPKLYEKGVSERTLDEEYFEKCFRAFKEKIDAEGIELTSQYFPGGSQQAQSRFKDLLLASIGINND